MRNNDVEIWDAECDSCTCEKCNKKKNCDEECSVVHHVGVNWAAFGPVDPKESIRFAELVLKRSLEAQKRINKYKAKGIRVLPFCFEYLEG